jgi:Leucine-rich repeat (LRR) protein
MKIKVTPHSSVKELQFGEQFLFSLNLNTALWQEAQEIEFPEDAKIAVFGMSISPNLAVYNREWVWRFETKRESLHFYLGDQLIAAQIFLTANNNFTSAFSDIPAELECLSMANLKIRNLPITLKDRSNLKNLDLSSCESLSDVSALSGLTNLTSLDLGNCKRLNSLSGLYGLTNLR